MPRVVGRAEYRTPPPQDPPSAAGTARMPDAGDTTVPANDAPTTRFSVAKNAVKNAVNSATTAARSNRPPAPPARIGRSNRGWVSCAASPVRPLRPVLRLPRHRRRPSPPRRCLRRGRHHCDPGPARAGRYRRGIPLGQRRGDPRHPGQPSRAGRPRGGHREAELTRQERGRRAAPPRHRRRGQRRGSAAPRGPPLIQSELRAKTRPKSRS